MEKDIERIKTWLRNTGMTSSRLGLLACGNPHAVGRILAGGGTVASFRKILRYIDANPNGEPK